MAVPERRGLGAADAALLALSMTVGIYPEGVIVELVFVVNLWVNIPCTAKNAGKWVENILKSGGFV
jgi:hypothetical protein